MIFAPRYLDRETIKSMFEAAGEDLPTTVSIDERSVGVRARSARANVQVVAGEMNSGTTVESAQSFERTVSNGEIVARALLALESGGMLSRPGSDSDLVHRSVVEVTGDLTISPITDVSQVLETMLMIAGSRSGGIDSIGAEEAAAVFLASGGSTGPAVMHLDDSASGYGYFMVLNRRSLLSDSFEALEGELTVLGVLEKVVPEGASIPLDRYLLPGVNRAIRNMLQKDSLDEMLASLEQSGVVAGPIPRVFEGPGAMLKAAVIYP